LTQSKDNVDIIHILKLLIIDLSLSVECIG